MAILSVRADTLAVGESRGFSALEDVRDSSARVAALGDDLGEAPAAGAAGDFCEEALSPVADMAGDVADDVAAAGQRTASIMSVSSAEKTEPCTWTIQLSKCIRLCSQPVSSLRLSKQCCC